MQADAKFRKRVSSIRRSYQQKISPLSCGTSSLGDPHPDCRKLPLRWPVALAEGKTGTP
jgi:hypothetical protein